MPADQPSSQSERDERIRAAVRESIDLLDTWPLTWPLARDEKRELVIDTIAGNVAASLDRSDLPPDFPSLEA